MKDPRGHNGSLADGGELGPLVLKWLPGAGLGVGVSQGPTLEPLKLPTSKPCDAGTNPLLVPKDKCPAQCQVRRGTVLGFSWSPVRSLVLFISMRHG